MPKGVPQTEDGLSRRQARHPGCRGAAHYRERFPRCFMREISAAAGVGKSTLYDYFPTKDDILIAYVADEIHYITTQVKQSWLRTKRPEKIRRIMHKQLRVYGCKQAHVYAA